jgi:hypothetical protein
MANDTRNAAGLSPRAIRAFRWVLFGLLFSAAALTLLGLPDVAQAVAAGRWPRAALAFPPGILAVFIAGYAAYRLVLVRAGRYPAGKALAHVVLMLLVLGVVGGIVLELADTQRAQATATPIELARSLRSRDPEVRALAAELARHRPREAALRNVDRLIQLLEDPSPEVRRQARATLTVLAGRDVGGEGRDAVRRWREHWRTDPARK